MLSGFATKDPKGDVHEEIIKEGLAGEICPANIEVVVNGSKSQETKEAEAEPQRHFETADLNKSYEYVKREQLKALNAAGQADSDGLARTRTLYHFGMMLHSVQDFYSNTNYLKLKVDYLNNGTVDGAGYDPYSIDLFDWGKLAPGKPAIVHNNEVKYEPDKIVRRVQSSRPLADSTFGRVSRGLAIRETMRQWGYLEQLIKNKYGPDRSPLIIMALKEAGCQVKVPPDASETVGED